MRILIIAILLVASASAFVIQADSKHVGYNNAAYYAYEQGYPEAAEQLYLMALEENESYAVARYNLATLLFQQQQYAEAIPHLELLHEQNASNPNYAYDLAVNLIEEVRNGNNIDGFMQALDLYREVEAANPGFAHAKENIAVLERILAEAS